MEQYSDTYYIRKVLEGDTENFSFLMDRYGGAVFSLINRIVRNRELAEELTQDVFLKVYRKIRR